MKSSPQRLKKLKAKPIPVNIISGSLGTGKTTVINYLLSQKPPNERWAILVNEYGEMGVDAALLDGDSTRQGITLREVAGGCICCSAGFMFKVSLVFMLRERPDRLLIEPTGLATLSGILDTLSATGIREAVDLRSIVTLVDPSRPELQERSPTFHDQVEAADIILANRCDVASEEQLSSFDEWSGKLFPPKQYIARIQHGKIPIHLLDYVRTREPHKSEEPSVEDHSEASGHHHGHGHNHHHDHHDHNHHHDHHGHNHHHSHDHHDHNHHVHGDDNHHPSTPDIPLEAKLLQRKAHHSPEAATVGWVLEDHLVFAEDKLSKWLDTTMSLEGMTRLKAVVHTDTGWLAYNLVGPSCFGEDGSSPPSRPSAYRRNSRIELVSLNSATVDPEYLEHSLRKCLVDADMNEGVSRA